MTLPTITIDNTACLGPLECGQCLQICPMTVFIAGATKRWKFRETDPNDYHVYARYYDQCITCYKCVDACPAECIKVIFEKDTPSDLSDDETELSE
jgi:NAD-dependent dihydropyrimidine dehydrogenase PreA subunit